MDKNSRSGCSASRIRSGKTIDVDGKPFKVIGVYHAKAGILDAAARGQG